MAGQRPGIAKLHRTFRNSLDRRRAKWFAARSHWHIEVIRGCDAERGGALPPLAAGYKPLRISTALHASAYNRRYIRSENMAGAGCSVWTSHHHVSMD